MNSIASDFFHDFHPSCPGEDHPRFTVYVTGLIAYQHPRISPSPQAVTEHLVAMEQESLTECLLSKLMVLSVYHKSVGDIALNLYFG